MAWMGIRVFRGDFVVDGTVVGDADQWSKSTKYNTKYGWKGQ